MIEEYLEYLSQLYQCIPKYVYAGGVALLVLSVVLIISLAGFRKGLRHVMVLILFEYCALIYCSTIIFRTSFRNTELKQIPFNGYVKIFDGRGVCIHPEMIMNVIVFIPLGIFLCAAFKGIKWWQSLTFGFFISLSIEVLQFLLERGTAEVADVIHNTLGCLIGIGLYYVLVFAYNKIKLLFNS